MASEDIHVRTMSGNSTDIIDRVKDFDWAEYNARINSYIQRVEEHLKLAPGTLADLKKDSDYLKILKMHATFEPLLNQLIERSITAALKHPKVNFPAGDAVASMLLKNRLGKKIDLAQRAELITASQAEFIRTVAEVRNFYAHSIENMALSIITVAQLISPRDKGRRFLHTLFGVEPEVQKGSNGMIVLVLLQPTIFNMFSSIVHAVVRAIDPPPLAPGQFGLLGGLFSPPEAPQADVDVTGGEGN